MFTSLGHSADRSLRHVQFSSELVITCTMTYICCLRLSLARPSSPTSAILPSQSLFLSSPIRQVQMTDPTCRSRGVAQVYRLRQSKVQPPALSLPLWCGSHRAAVSTTLSTEARVRSIFSTLSHGVGVTRKCIVCARPPSAFSLSRFLPLFPPFETPGTNDRRDQAPWKQRPVRSDDRGAVILRGRDCGKVPEYVRCTVF